MSNHEEELGHGHSVAVWVAVITAIVGVTIGTLGVCLPQESLMVIGSVITVASLILGPLLAKLGYGVAGKSGSAK
jgi:hydrogenase/urease accessory protein HupE